MNSQKDPIADALSELANGRSVTLVATGTSMRPRIESGQSITIAPVGPADVRIDDIVLVRWKKGRYIVHLVKEIDEHRVLIGNIRGKINGWVEAVDVLGIVTNV